MAMKKTTYERLDGNAMMGVNPYLNQRPHSQRSANPEFERPCRSIGKMLHSFSVDGVAINGSTLLHRQYDESKGAVDPASDIHTDPHLLQDALMRRKMTTGNATIVTASTETAETSD